MRETIATEAVAKMSMTIAGRAKCVARGQEATKRLRRHRGPVLELVPMLTLDRPECPAETLAIPSATQTNAPTAMLTTLDHATLTLTLPVSKRCACTFSDSWRSIFAIRCKNKFT